MGLSSRTLEITVISGENLSVTEDAYVVVRAESIKSCTTKMAKKSDGNNKNSSFISWNEKFLLDMSLHARSISFEVQCKKFKGARPLGVARIAVSDFLGGDVPENCLQVLSYGLRDWEGRRNGVIHFSVRVAAVSALEPVASNKDIAGDQLMGINVRDQNCNGVVVGVPFWWNYPNII